MAYKIPAEIMRSSHFTFKQRNFDPETRQSRKRDKEDEPEDTVEKAVEGLAEQIIKEDEEKRAEELVSCKDPADDIVLTFCQRTMLLDPCSPH